LAAGVPPRAAKQICAPGLKCDQRSPYTRQIVASSGEGGDEVSDAPLGVAKIRLNVGR
jgi:hypothetical protein